MYQITLNSTGEVLAKDFPTLFAANQWHDEWLDKLFPDGDGFDDDKYPSVTFAKM